MSRPPKKTRQNLVGQIAVAILVMVGFFWFMQMGRAPIQVMVRRDCENRYRQAHGRADTAAIDQQVSPLEQGRVTVGKTCGALRAAGALH
jgi:hypothetical protein